MKKIVIILLLCICGWLAKLTYDFYLWSEQSASTQNKIHTIEKQSNKLNDQIAALSRTTTVTESGHVVTESTLRAPQLNVMHLISQQLDFVEFALSQYQSIVAVQQLQALDLQLDAYELAPALKQSLHQVVAKDIEMIKQYAAQIASQQQQTQHILQKIDQMLIQELQQPNLTIAVHSDDSFWKKWLNVEKNTAPIADLQQRSLILKEVQLRLLILRELLLKHEYLAIQQELNNIIALIKGLPDQNSQNILKQLEQLKKMPKITVPQLNVRTLLG